MKFLPSSTLRFVLIVLAISVTACAIGLVIGYQQYQEYERVSKKLVDREYSVEFREVKLAERVVGKRITGLVVPRLPRKYANSLADIHEIPYPGEMLRLSHSRAIPDQQQLDALLAEIARYSSLEALYLNMLTFPNPDLTRLGELRTLTTLDYTHADGQARGLRFLDQLKNLETLRLTIVGYQVQELFEYALPKLRVLELKHVDSAELPLTRGGFGHFPELRVLILETDTIRRVAFEPNAMPQLTAVSLVRLGPKAEIDWAQLPTAAPNLTALAIHVTQLKPELIAMLARLPQLRWVHLHHDAIEGVAENRGESDLLPRNSRNEIVWIAPEYAELAKELLAKCPGVEYTNCYMYKYFLDDLRTPLFIEEREGMRWITKAWRSPFED